MFGYQFLNGCNPVLIQRCTKLPEKLPVTTEMVECSLERQLTLEQEVEVRPGLLGTVIQSRGQTQWLGHIMLAETTFCGPVLTGPRLSFPGSSVGLIDQLPSVKQLLPFPGHL